MGALRIGGGARVTILASAVILLVGGWQIARSRDVAMVNAGRQARVLASALAEHAARTLDGVDLILTGVIDQIETSADRSNLKAMLTRRAATVSQVHKLALLAADGLWASDSVGPHTPLTSADRAYFRWHRDHEDPGAHIDLPIVSHYDGKTVIPVSRRVNRPDGAFDGVVGATLNPESFRAFYDDLRLGEHGAFALWLESGYLLVREPEAPSMMGRDHSGDRLFSRELPAAAAGVFLLDASSIDGKGRIVAFQRLGRYPLIVTAAVAVEDVLAPWRNEALIEAFVMTVATTALLGLGLGLERRDRRVAQSERASREAQSLFRALFESSTDSQFVYRVEPDGDFRLEARNPAAAEAMGFPSDAVSDLRAEQVMARGLIDEIRADLRLALVAERPIRLEHDVDLGGGKNLEVMLVPLRDQETAQFDRIFVGARDITHLKAAEAEAREANRLLVMAEQVAHVGHWHIALPSQRLTWSDEVFRIHGLDPASFAPTLERGIAAYHPDDRARVAECVARALERGEPFEFELRILRPDGETRHVHCRGLCQLGRKPDGLTEEGRSIFGVFADVTEQRRQSARIESALIAAEAGARIKAEFLANMSHELRTPLTGMLGVHDLLQSDAALTAQQSRLIRLAQESGRALLAIVNDILDFSKIEAGQLAIDAEPFDLAALMESCGALSAEAADGSGLMVSVEIDPAAPRWLVGDAARLRQVLLNLATNAIKFTQAGGVIIRALWRESGEGGGRLRIEVADTGIGIAADKLPKLFERFSQADGSISRQYGGTGLGLAICRRLAELMGGEIGVESEIGKGSTFWVALPLSRGAAQAAPARSHLAETAPSPRRILVAEDNPINQEIIADVLRRKGHSVTLVGDGAAAVAAVRNDPAYDIVLMDIQMPGKDGLSATMAIRDWERESGRARVPVVALTANAMAEEAESCRAAGMDAHVAKPVDWGALFAAIERLVKAGGDAAPVLDEATLEALAALVGGQRIPGLLTSFADEIARRMERVSAPAATEADLASEAHALVSLAGQLGFAELSLLCRELEKAAADGGEGLGRLDELRRAASRAVEAASRSPHARAA